MLKNRFTREQAIDQMKVELSPFVVNADKACSTDPISYKIFVSADDDRYIEHGEFGYKDYSKPDVLLQRLRKIKEFLLS
ncbi:hypothetical protein PZA22_04940 [Pectobacterium polaris]|uniref:hypothetical protein n=1 Tax=Pectobacterium polaris TaxID=2042057 RepID=UPI002175DBB6|nr:hypothetical protein [Pectobacterium polaris]MDE8753855.1 hypothetical protein [Pectobacterium polaris]